MAHFTTREEGCQHADEQARRNGHTLTSWQEERALVGAAPGPVSLASCTRCGCRVYVYDHESEGTALTLTCQQAQRLRDHPEERDEV